jgi:aminoglycoside/choline kinase family phosphotransferase
MDLEATLRGHAARATGLPAAGAPVLKLKGDASSRSYYRVGHPPESVVLMVMPPDAAVRSDEVTHGAIPQELPFLNVHRYLQRVGVRVPRVLLEDVPAGVLVLEDLGDLTFEQALRGGDRTRLYREAVQLLASLRVAAERAPDPGCLAFTRAFDERLYDWELHHFREWGLEVWSGRTPSPDERALLDRSFQELAAELAQAPRGFTHRDYQSRNLMVKGGELVLIDFQDALLGPRQYDLVALLRDSYVELDPDFVDAMLDEYLIAVEVLTGEQTDPVAFKASFDLLTVQRKLKDAGRFEFLDRVKGNPSFLPSIPASLRYVRDAFARLPRLAPLQRLLAAYVPELG